jgi:hypothetical protein
MLVMRRAERKEQEMFVQGVLGASNGMRWTGWGEDHILFTDGVRTEGDVCPSYLAFDVGRAKCCPLGVLEQDAGLASEKAYRSILLLEETLAVVLTNEVEAGF